jgi:hypothetical protein
VSRPKLRISQWKEKEEIRRRALAKCQASLYSGYEVQEGNHLSDLAQMTFPTEARRHLSSKR